MPSNITLVHCPWHDEKTPSCRVDYDHGRVLCLGCGKEATMGEFHAAWVDDDPGSFEAQAADLALLRDAGTDGFGRELRGMTRVEPGVYVALKASGILEGGVSLADTPDRDITDLIKHACSLLGVPPDRILALSDAEIAELVEAFTEFEHCRQASEGEN